jgi:hypothetical protein
MHTAVLFLVFNRPDNTARVFEAIRKAHPPRLYVAADGPRRNREGEDEKVDRVREIATRVDWSCDVKTLFREENLGCKYAVSGGISWFFEHEEQGIIVEDDCLPHPDFFSFCESLLDRYANDERVWVITGDNFQNGIQRGAASYYFSRYNHVWGWASWRRAWQMADMDIRFWPDWKHSANWKSFWLDRHVRRYWENIFDRMHRAEIDTWDYPWTASVWYHGGLTATPNVNLVSNIGFGPDSTHTGSANSALAAMATKSLGELRHPLTVVQDVEADRFIHYHSLNRQWRRIPYLFFHLSRHLLETVLGCLKQR